MEKPFDASSLGISVAGTAVALTAVALPVPSNLNDGEPATIRIVNEGPNICFIALGASTVLATLPTTGAGVTTCVAVLSGEDIVLSRSNILTDRYISTICRAAGTATLSVYVGKGA